ncbi:MAG: hypothetical protein JSW60_04975 [Thermoplasmatales archaeon]|nr:MAG: hypothetical protein JSW60_04975 [Thermoplasmatales archaeon]
MKRLLWLGLLFISSSWLFFIPIFTSTEWKTGVFFLTIGILCNIIALRKDKPKQIDKKHLVLLIPLVLSILIINYPYNIGLIVLAIGLLVYAVTNQLKYEKTHAVIAGISLSGVIFTIQTALFPFYSIIVSHGHRIDILSPIVSSVGNLLGLKTSVNNGIVFVQTFQQTYPFTTTLEKLGFYTWFNILIGFLVLLVLLYGKRKILLNIFIFFIGSFLYLILRYVAFIHLYISTVELDIFWNPWYMSISFIPLALLLMKILPLKDGDIGTIFSKNLKINRKQVTALVMIFIFVFSMIGAFAFQDPGCKKNGRVLIDEYHSDWEDTTKPLTKDWYGMLSTYNYYSWAEWLNHYYHVERNNNTLTTSLLENYDILILKCPTNSYSTQEIWSVVQFVEKGGGLYLIGDHTDVFGMNTFLNQVSDYFGIRFKTDATYELGTGMMSVYEPDDMFPHTTVQNVKQFDFMTSCTLEAPFTSENVIIGNRLISEPGTYSTENFFRESTASPESEYGFLLQVVAVKYGKGRVVAFSDSTVFSSFSMFSDGYQSFTLGVMEYLNRVNSYQYLNTVLFAVAIFSLIVSIYLLRNERKTKILFLFLLVGLLSFSTAKPVFSYMIGLHYPLPNAHSDYIQVCFDQEYSGFNVSLQPTLGLYYEKDNYGTFYVWTQRVGCIPSLEKTLEGATKKGDIVVFINPIKSFETEDVDTVTNFVENGGRILLMDSIRNSDSTANELIGNFGIWINYNTAHRGLHHSFNDSSDNSTIGNITSPYLSITGGERVLFSENNETYASVAEFYNETTGKTGKIVVVVDSYSFSDPIMGGAFTEPDERQMQIFNTEFFIFEELLLNDISTP